MRSIPTRTPICMRARHAYDFEHEKFANKLLMIVIQYHQVKPNRFPIQGASKYEIARGIYLPTEKYESLSIGNKIRLQQHTCPGSEQF